MLLVDLVYSHGDDWFMFPVAGRSGSIVTSDPSRSSIRSAGITPARPPSDNSPRYPGLRPPADFSLFACKGLRPKSLVLWPVAEAPLESAPLERVQFGMDEQSNLLWALERIINSSRSPARRRRSRCRASSLSGACTRWRYDPREELRLRPRLGSRVALAPLQARLGRGGRAGLLPMGPRRLFPPASTTHAASRGRGAEGGGPGGPQRHRIAAAAMAAGGMELERRWQLGRDVRGRPVLWVQRQRRALRTPPARNLRFDLMVEVAPVT